MDIDGNEKMRHGYALEKDGKLAEGHRLRDEFVAEVGATIKAGGDHCSCRVDCPYHGRCMECVAIHRGHRDHVPSCLAKIGG